MTEKKDIIFNKTSEDMSDIQDESVDCIVTSPPYWALRDYGVDGQLGLEKTFEEYINKLCDIFDEGKRVLKKEGTCWVNLGDSYLSNKSLCMIPQRFAIEMINRGWILRNTIIWCLEENTMMFIKDENGNFFHIPISKVIPGMKVITQGRNNQFNEVKILNVFNNGNKDTLKIKTKTGREVICTPDHQFVVKKSTTIGGSYRKLKIKKASELKITDFFYVNENFNIDLGKNKKDYRDGFIVGFYLAEGSYIKNKVGIYKDNKLSKNSQKRWGGNAPENKIVGVQFSCGIKDISSGYIEYLKRYKINTYTYKNNVVINSRDKKLLQLIREFVDDDTCYKKHLSQSAFNQGNIFIDGILDGFLAGDGCYIKKEDRYRIGITRKNKKLVEDLQILSRLLGYDFRCNFRDNKYTGVADIAIRKKSVRKRSFGCITDKIESIEKNGEKKVFDIEIQPLYTGHLGNNQYKNKICGSSEKIKLKYNNLYFLANGIWTHNCKPNAMPSSAKDRFTVDFEYLYFFVKSKKYYFEQQLEPYTKPMNRWGGEKLNADGESNWDEGTGQKSYRDRNMRPNPKGRNKRCVWKINTKSYKGAHFAVYPEELIEAPIKAGCPENGIVLDPFMGAGTTALVAKKSGKNFIGYELNPEYIEIIKKRLSDYEINIMTKDTIISEIENDLKKKSIWGF